MIPSSTTPCATHSSGVPLPTCPTTHSPVSSAEHHFVSPVDDFGNDREHQQRVPMPGSTTSCARTLVCICLGSIACNVYGPSCVHLPRFHRAQLVTQPLQVRFRFRPPKNLNWTESSVLSGSGSGSQNPLNWTQSPVLGSGKSALNRTEPDFGNTTCKGDLRLRLSHHTLRVLQQWLSQPRQRARCRRYPWLGKV
jgi:hypothetical protein